MNNLITSQPSGAGQPKALLNWMVLDEQFALTNTASYRGAVQVPLITAGATKAQLTGPVNMVVQKSGYLYVYVSNESNMNVYFDDVVVNHKSGPVLEINNYRAFGTEIATLSAKAYGKTENKYKYNGKELQSKEFSDGSGIDEYDYGARHYDSLFGRWMVQDPLAETSRRWSVYNYCYNNPLRFTDPDGMRPENDAERFQNRIVEKKEEEKLNHSNQPAMQGMIDNALAKAKHEGNQDEDASGNTRESNSNVNTGNTAVSGVVESNNDDGGNKGKKGVDPHAVELAKYGQVVSGGSSIAMGGVGLGVAYEYGSVNTDKHWHQNYYTIYKVITTASVAATANIFIVNSRDGYNTTFSDWAGPVKEAGGNYGLVSFSYGWSTTYTTWSIGVGPGASLPKVGTGAYFAGTTYLIGQPYYLNEGGNDPDDNRGTHVVH